MILKSSKRNEKIIFVLDFIQILAYFCWGIDVRKRYLSVKFIGHVFEAL